MNSKDVRDVIKITRLAKKDEDISMIIEALQEYRENKNNKENKKWCKRIRIFL